MSDPAPDESPVAPGSHAPDDPLPPEVTWVLPGERPAWWRTVLREAGLLAAAVFLVLLASGLLGGLGGLTWRSLDGGGRPGAWTPPAGGSGSAAAEDLLRWAERLRRSASREPGALLAAAGAFLEASRGLDPPRDRLVRQEAITTAGRAWDLHVEASGGAPPEPVIPSRSYLLRKQQAYVYAEAGREAEARAIYDELLAANAEGETYLRAYLLNNAAWLLLTAKRTDLRDPGRAMALVRTAVKLHPDASRSATILDTLALAHYTAGDVDRAVTVQRRALAHANPSELPALIESYDRFVASQEEDPAHGDAD